MCNRFKGVLDPKFIDDVFGVRVMANYEDNPNVAPTDTVPIIRTSHSKGRAPQIARFGMIPSWAKDKKIGLSLLNARLETIEEKPSFKDAWRKRRCIIPAEGYYEWRTENGKKQPYLFTRKDGGLMSLAGLWDYAELNNEKIFSFCLITNEPNSLASPIHDRMPCVLEQEKIDDWLDVRQDGRSCLNMFPSEEMTVKAVNPAMNKPGMKDRNIIEAPFEAQAEPDANLL